jgi:hypothetical protein
MELFNSSFIILNLPIPLCHEIPSCTMYTMMLGVRLVDLVNLLSEVEIFLKRQGLELGIVICKG